MVFSIRLGRGRRGLSLAPHGGELLAIGHQRPASVGARAVEAEHAVVGAAAEREAVLVELIIAPDADGIEPDQDRFVIPGELDRDASPVAIDRAAELGLALLRL